MGERDMNRFEAFFLRRIILRRNERGFDEPDASDEQQQAPILEGRRTRAAARREAGLPAAVNAAVEAEKGLR